MTTISRLEACMKGKKVNFYKTLAVVNELVAAKADGSLVQLLKKLSNLFVDLGLMGIYSI